MSDIYDVDEVAALLKVSRQTIKREIAEHRLDCIRVRGRVLVRRADLDAYINQLANQ